MESGCDTLELEHIIGFSGNMPGCLLVHPDNMHLIYPIGFNVMIEDISTGHQSILSKHTQNVTSITIDPTGRYIATGQINFQGFKAPLIIWDYKSRKPIMTKELHKVKIQALSFTSDSAYLISLGGRDCGAVVVWSIARQEALCGSPAQPESASVTNCLVASKVDPSMFITAGNNIIRVWQLEASQRKIKATNVRLGGCLKREVMCIELADHWCSRPFLFCGTPSGEILGINILNYQLQFLVPGKDRFSLGVSAMCITAFHNNKFDLLIGTGDGLVGRYEMQLSIVRHHHVTATLKHNASTTPWRDITLNKRGAVTSIAKRGIGHIFYVGTANCQIYKFTYSELSATLIKTSHSCPINSIIFAFASSSLFVTCAFEDIRVWNSNSGQELCRYTVRNMTCNDICITKDGGSIFSAWDDGRIRVIGFKKDKAGKVKLFEKFIVEDVHNRGTTAIDITIDGTVVVTGGGEGQLRVWNIKTENSGAGKNRSYGELMANMKEHEAKITCIRIHTNNRLCASTCAVGSAIVWDLVTFTRRQIMMAKTMFKCLRFGPSGVSLLTCGSDHKICFWDINDGSLMRELQGSMTGCINALDISTDGRYFVSGGEEKILKMWRYNNGDVTRAGIGHSDDITEVCICPNRKVILSSSADGAVHIWKYPDLPLSSEISF